MIFELLNGYSTFQCFLKANGYTSALDMWNRIWNLNRTFYAKYPLVSPRSASSTFSTAVVSAVAMHIFLLNKDVTLSEEFICYTTICLIYSDDFLDDPANTEAEKLKYTQFLQDILRGKPRVAYSPKTAAILEAWMCLVHSVKNLTSIKSAVLDIMKVHHENAAMRGFDLDITLYKDHAIKMGGYTTRLYASNVDTDEQMRQTIYDAGGLMQLLDDAVDVDDDIGSDIKTFATESLRIEGNLDGYVRFIRATLGLLEPEVEPFVFKGLRVLSDLTISKIGNYLSFPLCKKNIRIWRAKYESSIKDMLEDLTRKRYVHVATSMLKLAIDTKQKLS